MKKNEPIRVNVR